METGYFTIQMEACVTQGDGLITLFMDMGFSTMRLSQITLSLRITKILI